MIVKSGSVVAMMSQSLRTTKSVILLRTNGKNPKLNVGLGGQSKKSLRELKQIGLYIADPLLDLETRILR